MQTWLWFIITLKIWDCCYIRDGCFEFFRSMLMLKAGQMLQHFTDQGQQTLSLTSSFPSLTIFHWNFYSKAKLLAPSPTCYIPWLFLKLTSSTLWTVQGFIFQSRYSHSKWRAVSLCRAPIPAQQRLLSSRGSLWFSTGASPEHPWDLPGPGLCFLRNPSSDSRFLWLVSWFGRLQRQNTIRSSAIGGKCLSTTVDIFCTRKATTILIVIARQDPPSHLSLLTYWGFLIITFSTLSEQWMSPCCHPLMERLPHPCLGDI